MIEDSPSALAVKRYLAETRTPPTPAGLALAAGLGEPDVLVEEYTSKPAPFAHAHMSTRTSFCVVYEDRVAYVGRADQRLALHEIADRLPGAEVRELIERVRTQVVGRAVGKVLTRPAP